MLSLRLLGPVGILGGVLVLAGCSASSPTDLPESSQPSAPSVSSVPSAPPGFPAGARIDYQLGGAYPPPEGVGIVVRDVMDSPAEGIYSVCYVNAFQTQPGRSAQWLADGLVLEDDGEPVADPDWPDEYLLDTGTPQHREEIAERIGAELGQCAERGFDAVELDNLDSYARSDGLLDLGDNVALATALVERAHGLGLLAGQKNTAEESATLRDAGFDFAVAEQCVEFEECSAYLDVYGPAVLAIEYPAESSRTEDPCRSTDRPASTVLRDRDLTTPGNPAYLYRAC